MGNGSIVHMFVKGDLVCTPCGKGKVEWVRMAGPDYLVPQAVSVRLDSKKDHPTYTGTVFPASDVMPQDS
jgi:hypothetical protein